VAGRRAPLDGRKTNKQSQPNRPVTLQIAVLRDDLGYGRVLLRPLGDLTLSCTGDENSAVQELTLFLETLLPAQPPQLATRFRYVPGSEVRPLLVAVDTDWVPKRLALKSEIELDAVLIPQGSAERPDHWVLLPSIDHTFYLQAHENLEEVGAREASRMIALRCREPSQVLHLIAPRDLSLFALDVTLPLPELKLAEKARALRRRLAERRKRRQAREVLDSVGMRLDARSLSKQPRICGRDELSGQLCSLLSGERRLALLLVGPALVGKSALVKEWLVKAALAEPRQPPSVYATSAAQLIAGMSGLGQWQERLRRVLEAAELLDAVLYIDSLSEIFGDRPSGQVDIAGSLRPYLQQQRVRLIAEARPESLDLYQARHASFLATMHRVDVPPLDRKQTHAALSALIEHAVHRTQPGVHLDAAAIPALLDLVDRYLPHACYPGKAVRLYREVISNQDELTRGQTADAAALYRVFAARSGIPLFLLDPKQSLDVARVSEALAEQVIGQRQAVERAAQTVCLVKAQLYPPEKPLATFLFVGPTGVGKTELARALARYLFGSAERLVRFDMSEYGDTHAAERLIRGHGQREGALTQRVRQQPFCILLLDEIEKADGAVFDLLLSVLGEGRLTDAAGRTTSFNNAIVIMTSNLGAQRSHQKIGLQGTSHTANERLAAYEDEIARSFRPEFVNRLDSVIVFDSLARVELAQIAQIAISRISMRRGIAERRNRFFISDAATAALLDSGIDTRYGARALRRELEDRLVVPIAELLARAGSLAEGAALAVSAQREPPKKADRHCWRSRPLRCASSFRRAPRSLRRHLRRTPLRSGSYAARSRRCCAFRRSPSCVTSSTTC
jgi:ATP-dependent Clp protease ATP-binding subunit ClpC